jgi:hypothetical protein
MGMTRRKNHSDALMDMAGSLCEFYPRQIRQFDIGDDHVKFAIVIADIVGRSHFTPVSGTYIEAFRSSKAAVNFEDEPLTRMCVVDVLKELGHSVTETGTAKEPKKTDGLNRIVFE